MKEIQLSTGKYHTTVTPKHFGKYSVMVDDEDYEELMKYSWCPLIRKHTVYAYTRYIGKTILLHRMVMKITDPEIQVDHIDKNGLNCQKGNLRGATVSQNNAYCGRKKNGSSIYKGVDKPENRYWRARTKNEDLGFFRTEIEAAKAYDVAAKKLYGAFANLNFKN